MEARELERLEYNKILEWLSRHCSFSLSRAQALALRPTSELEVVERELDAVDEGWRLLLQEGDLPFGGISDVTGLVQKAAVGSVLASQQLAEILWTVEGAGRLSAFVARLKEGAERFPLLTGWAASLPDLRELQQALDRALDEQGELRDEASPELYRIRKRIQRLEDQIKERLEEMVRNPAIAHMLQEPIITQRQGHWVLPVKAGYRNVLGGVVWDQSATGSTLFVEPEEVAANFRQLQEARVQESKEIERILTQLTREVARHREQLLEMVALLARLDLVMAKSRLARQMGATRPVMNEQGRLRLRQARHPLLDPQTAVPIELELGENDRILVITGPNTGGKTVTLKTIGLLSLMAMSGMFVPAAEGTELSTFSGVFADIGDEQSIEQNLSTFSSHMTHIVHMLRQATKDSLLLFDELGAGTDPQEGSALAVAILDHLLELGCVVAATTHYSELKSYAYNRAGVLNASVAFDEETLQPTYQLLIGVPGRSHAFAISERLGLAPAILQKARAHLDEESRSLERVLSSLEEHRRQLHREQERIRQLREELEQERLHLVEQQERLKRQQQQWDKRKESLMQEAVEQVRAEARQLLEQLDQLARAETVKPHQVAEAKKRWAELEGKVQRSPAAQAPDIRPSDKPLDVGAEVWVSTLAQRGTVLEIKGKQAVVQVGPMRMTLSAKDLTVLESAASQGAPVVTLTGLNRSFQAVKTELDLRGQTVEEALPVIDKYLDEATLAGYSQVRIIHGKGTGLLRRGIQDYLRRHPHVRTFRTGEYAEGGNGVTVVELK